MSVNPARWAARAALVDRWRALPEERRGVALVLLLAGVVFLPRLGSVGLWDPWEPHYAEVARQMIVRGDYVHPYWENAYFFSKPVLLFWLDALAMGLAGVQTRALRPAPSPPGPPRAASPPGPSGRCAPRWRSWPRSPAPSSSWP